MLLYSVQAQEELLQATPQLAHSDDCYQAISPTASSSGDHNNFIGPTGCVECHQAEFAVWKKTNHATSAYDILRTSSNAKQYAENLGFDSDLVSKNDRCLSCHSTPQSEVAESTGQVMGVTCEACHNAAGGENGWLNLHAVYGPNGFRRENESATHRAQRLTASKAAGQIRSDDLYALAKRCYQCHVIGDEELVVVGGHHPSNTGFEMTSWFINKTRHNLFLNPHHNRLASSLWIDSLWRENHQPGQERDHLRLMYVVSMLVDIELSLCNRAKATHASYASAAATRIVSASSRLAQIANHQTTPELIKVISIITELEEILFAPPKPKNSQPFHEAAHTIKKIATKISAAGDGARYSTADQFLDFQAK